MKDIEYFKNKIMQRDCLEIMKEIPDNSIDTIITDPPYGLEFMGSKWDKFPLQDRGKRLTGSGKPTEARGFAKNVAYGYSKESLSAYQEFSYKWAKEALRVAKPGTTLLCFGSPRTYHRTACGIEDAGWTIKDCIMWIYGSGFPKATDIGKKIKEFEGWKSHGLKPAYEPILVAMKPNEGNYAENALKHGVAGLNIDGGRITLNGEKNPSGSAKRIYKKNQYNENFEYGDNKITPDKGRYPANVILECTCDKVKKSGNKKEPYNYKGREYRVKGFIKENKPQAPSNYNDQKSGVIHTNPECPCYMLDKQSGILKSGLMKQHIRGGKYNVYGKMYPRNVETIGDEGGASRFFYCAKTSKAERNMGCEGLEEKPRSMANKMMGQSGEMKTGSGNERTVKFKNNHPTVKPLALMEYLCTLTKTPTGGIVLDPFAGSGTTGIACKKIGRDYILIERDKSYCEIARRRIKVQMKPLF